MEWSREAPDFQSVQLPSTAKDDGNDSDIDEALSGVYQIILCEKE